MNDKPTLLYILAPSFSGSTLLTYLLAQHDAIATVGEFKATQMGPPEDYHCSCGDPILSCEFWNSVRAEAAARGIEFSVDEFGTVFDGGCAFCDKVVQATVRGALFERVRSLAIHMLPGVSKRLRSVARRNVDLADIVCHIQGGRIFLDGSKDSARLLHLINSDAWQVRVIYLQRDGRGVSSSIRKHEVISYDAAIGEWLHSVRELQRMRRRLDPAQVFDLHYEDLCMEPASCMQRIWDWLGIESLAINKKQFKSGDYHILGNAMRLGTLSEIRLDERWREAMSESELEQFEIQAGAVNRQLGYR